MFGHPVAAQLLRERPTLARIIFEIDPVFTPLGTLCTVTSIPSFHSSPPRTLRPSSIRTSRTHEDDQPTNRLPHCRAFRGQPSRRSQSAQCKGEHGQHQPCNVHPPRKSTTSTRSGAIPRGKVRSSTHAPPQFDHSSHRGHARDRMQPVVLGFTSILAQCGGGCAGVRLTLCRR